MALVAAYPLASALIAGTAVAGAGAAITTRNAGIAASQDMKAQAVKEGDASRGREIERKRALLRALSQQSARAGAAGVNFDGSLAGAARTDIRDATNDLLVDRSNTRSTQAGLRTGARNARRQGNLGAAASLFDTGAKIAGQL
jgi:hypothetical protein